MAIREEDQHNIPEKPYNLKEKDYREQTNGNRPDPSAKRNIGLNGETERNDQKDKLANKHIAGDETTGYGANDPDNKEAFAQGPGFEFEGSYDNMDAHANGVRSTDQPFGSDETEESDADYSRI